MSVRQMFFTTFVALTTFSAIDIPYSMTKSFQRSGWLVIICAGIAFGLLAMLCLKSRALLCENSKIQNGFFNKYFNSAVYMLLYLFIEIYFCRSLAKVITENFLPTTPRWSLYLVTVALMAFVADRGIIGCARLSELTGTMFIAATLVICGFMFFKGQKTNILPVFDTNEIEFSKNNLRNIIIPFCGTELMLMPKDLKSKKPYLFLFLSVLFAGIIYALSIVSTQCVLGVNNTKALFDAFIESLKATPVPIIERLDILYLTVGLTAMFTGMSVFFCSANEHRKKMIVGINNKISLMIFGALIFIFCVLADNIFFVWNLIYELIPILIIICAFAIPLVIIICCMTPKQPNKKSIISIFLSFTLIVSLCGCKDAKDINKKKIISAVLMDCQDQNITFYVEVADTTEGYNKDNQNTKYECIKGTGKTITESRKDLDRNLGAEPYLGAIRTVIFTSRFANKYLCEYLNRLQSEEEYRKKVMLAFTNQNPEKLFEYFNKKDKSLGFSTEEMIADLTYNNEAYELSTVETLNRIQNGYSSVCLPQVGIKEGEFSILGYGITDKEGIKSFVDAKDACPLVFLNGNVAKCENTVNYGGQDFAVNVTLKNKSIDVFDGGNTVNITISCYADLKIMYSSKTDDIITKNEKDEIKKYIKEKTKSDILKLVRKTQNCACDPFLIGEKYRIKYPADFKKINWPKKYKTANVSVFVNTKTAEAKK